jgi:hypothetical protein
MTDAQALRLAWGSAIEGMGQQRSQKVVDVIRLSDTQIEGSYQKPILEPLLKDASDYYVYIFVPQLYLWLNMIITR